jgi:hypothetical protein
MESKKSLNLLRPFDSENTWMGYIRTYEINKNPMAYRPMIVLVHQNAK